MSQLLHVKMEGGHSQEAWAERLGMKKAGASINDFSKLTPELLERCRSDVQINARIYEVLHKKLNRKEFERALDVEHRLAFVCLGMHLDGFQFDLEHANALHSEIDARIIELDKLIASTILPKAVGVRVVTPRRTAKGTIHRGDFRWYDGNDYTIFGGGEFEVFRYQQFDPGSPKQVVELLNKAGWKPINKTDGHIEAEKNKSDKLSHFKVYGWKVDEDNLATLPEDAPEAVKRLVERLMLRSRRSILESWFNEVWVHLTQTNIKNIMSLIETRLDKSIKSTIDQGRIANEIGNSNDTIIYRLKNTKNCLTRRTESVKFAEQVKVNSASTIAIPLRELEAFSVQDVISITNGTYSIHGQFNPIGTWTHRMAHRSPNLANIATEKSIKYKTENLYNLAVYYGGEMRKLWVCPDDCWLVGCDADQIQLRVLAHYLNDEKFIQALLTGKKENGTDLHTLNQMALAPHCKTRDQAKTFIYAFLLGAGVGKVAQILNCSAKEARDAIQRFIAHYPGLRRLKEEVIPRDASRGYFQGFDGRFIVCDSEHLMLAGYLQAGEAVIMKHANLLWRQDARREGLDFRQVNFVHDEWQTYCRGTKETAERLGCLQAEAIRTTSNNLQLHCTMQGNYRIGRNWHDTH